jgi:3-dehydrosphinganine reductase
MDFSGKLILITGGSSGIGLATACQLSRLGANIWILARDSKKLEGALQQIQEAARSADQQFGMLSADVTNWQEIKDVLTQWKSQIGIPDILINSSGIVEPGYFEETPLETFHLMMDVNYFGMLHVIKNLIPDMIARRSGHIVNISSGAGFVGWYGYGAYGPSKYAVRGLCEQLRTEMKPFGIKVSVVFPFDTQTPQLEYEDTRKPPETKALSSMIGSPVKAEFVAKTILNGITHGNFYIIPGLDVKVLFFLYNAFPGLVLPILDYLVKLALKKTNSQRRKIN